MHPIPILAALMLAVASPTWAGEGHDHGEAPAAMTGPALPRLTTASELFELVGELDGKRLTLWLDHAADTSPVGDSKLELELGGIKVPVQAHGEGEFQATLAQPLAPGEYPVVATVYAGEETDLLAGDLDIHSEAEASEATHTHGWQEYALWAAITGMALVGLAWLIRRLRSQRAGGVA